MKIRDLIVFIHEHDIEWHWGKFNDYGTENKDVVIFVYDHQLEEFRHLLHSSDYDDEGLEVLFKDNYFCLRMAGLCENNDIDICDVFDPEKKD